MASLPPAPPPNTGVSPAAGAVAADIRRWVFRAETFFLLPFNRCSFFHRIQGLKLSLSCIKPVKGSQGVTAPASLFSLPYTRFSSTQLGPSGTILTPVVLVASCFFYLEFSSLFHLERLLLIPQDSVNFPRSYEHGPQLPGTSVASIQLYEKSFFARRSCSVDLAPQGQRLGHLQPLHSGCPTKGLAPNRHN